MVLVSTIIRWRSSGGDEWSIHGVDLGVFDGHERGMFDGGFTDEFKGVCMQDDKSCQAQRPRCGHQREAERNRMETCVAAVRSVIDHFDRNRPNYYNAGMKVAARFARDAQAFVRRSLPSRNPGKISGTLNPR